MFLTDRLCYYSNKFHISSFVSFQKRDHGLDMNVLPAWERGFRGKGVVVSILDDGIEKDHPDLKNNYVSIIISLKL